MKFKFNRTNKDVQTITQDFSDGKLFVDTSYQRRKVWNEQDKVRLIETILMEFIMPEVYFWTADRDPETGRAATHIVDGQQRITTIVEFINNEFKLTEKYLLNDEIKKQNGNLYFNQLKPEVKNIIWGYSVSVVEIDNECTRDDIKNMFYRLNLTNYDLNSQEKRNSKDSKFGDKCESLSGFDFWSKVKLFSSADAKRMKDVEYCCSIFILANEGMIDQTNDKKINDYYDDYKDCFDEDNLLENKVIQAMNIIEEMLDKSTISFLSKKTQMYTMFCVAFKLIESGNNDLSCFYDRLRLFIEVYSKFRNEFDATYEDEELFELFLDIKKYKLASSEGVNKISNRVIRYETIYKICIESSDEILIALQKLSKDFDERLKKKEGKDTLELDDLVDIEG